MYLGTVKIYSTALCPYCVRAKNWFKEQDITYDEVILDNQDAIALYKEDCPGKTSVPQILINDILHEGGYDGLIANQDYVLGILKG